MFKKGEKGQNKEHEKQAKPFSEKTKKVITAILASVTGVSAVMVASAVIAYEAFFPRYERPDYALYPGEYCYERLKNNLHREVFEYQANDFVLKGYYYPSKDGKGLIVMAHGFHAGADDYLPIIEYFVEGGYNVFAYDGTGTYDSTGDSTIGMCQSLLDLDGTLNYIKQTSPYCQQPLFLVGHSWGGYAVASALELHPEVHACACIAPMNNGYTIMQEKAEQYVGKIANLSRPIFNAYQRVLFGDYVQYNGVRGINSTNAPVLIAQGLNDDVILHDKQSIMAYRQAITNPNVTYYVTEGAQGGHDSIWHSLDAITYQKQVQDGLKNLEKQKGEALSDAEKTAYYKAIDHALYSEVNKPLFDEILKMFDEQIKI